MRWTLVTLVVLAACGSKGGGGGGAAIAPATSATAPVSSATPTPVTSATPTAPARDPSPEELARLHAPLYRFNAWVAGDSSPQNKSEDFFPMSAARFFDEIASKNARVATRKAQGATPGTNEVKPFSSTPTLEADKIDGFPRGMSGDAPGTAPVYFHVVRDPARKDTVFIEYWLFYPEDDAKIKVFGATLSIGGHRGDWESVFLQVELLRGANGVFRGTEVRRGFYFQHGGKHAVDPQDLQLVDDAGQPDPRGKHPVVYVAVGKHASYPEPGRWPNTFGTAPFVEFDEYFLGNGFAWSSWKSPLLDLEAPIGPEFAPASFLALRTPATQSLTDWRQFPGGWGSDQPPKPLASSPRQPVVRTNEYGSMDRNAKLWSDVKRTSSIRLGAAQAVTPAPIPQRVP